MGSRVPIAQLPVPLAHVPHALQQQLQGALCQAIKNSGRGGREVRIWVGEPPPVSPWPYLPVVGRGVAPGEEGTQLALGPSLPSLALHFLDTTPLLPCGSLWVPVGPCGLPCGRNRLFTLAT